MVLLFNDNQKVKMQENMDTESESEITPLIFTRYLYPKELVMHSLFLSILDKKTDEALFWGYELYYSGFTDNVYDYLFQIYETIYSSMNSDKLTTYLKQLYGNQTESNLGIFILTLATKPYNINIFIEEYFNIKCSPTSIQKNNDKILKIKTFDTTPYKTTTLEISDEQSRGYKILKTACKYPIRTEYKELFTPLHNENGQSESSHDFLDCFRRCWEYYTFECPLWNQRILQYGGKKCDKTKKVSFDTETNAEEFYNKYDLEPDEQSLEIQYGCVGNPDVKQLSIKDFSKQYGGTIILKIKRQKL